eukprot:COSAG05_NODE_1344_length_5130_cov_5.136156_5_plen_93_part_00
MAYLPFAQALAWLTNVDRVPSLVIAALRVRGNIYNRPCAQQYVGKSQSCMVTSGRLIPHASVAQPSKHAAQNPKTCDSIVYTTSLARRSCCC